MAITNVSSGTLTWGSGSSPRTTSIDIGTLTDGVLYVILNNADADDDITGVSFAGTPGTQLGSKFTGANGLNVELWCVTGVSGTGTLSVSLSSDGTYSPKGAWASFSGINQTTPHGTVLEGQGTGSDISTSSGTRPAGGLLIGFSQHMTNASPFPVSSPAVSIVQNGAAASTWTSIATRDSDGTFYWDGSSVYAYAWYVVPVNSADGGGGNPHRASALLGIG